ncbi:MAG: hypothetical protein KDH09_12810 [Chrysiogenetes bacterium]|nr:hypothetical protein [Chrysiogenetes bacterium]
MYPYGANAREQCWLEHGHRKPFGLSFREDVGSLPGRLCWLQDLEVFVQSLSLASDWNGLNQCPVCFCFTLAALGRYDVCPVCTWEDDPEQVLSPVLSGANACCLLLARHSFERHRRCDPRESCPVRAPRPSETPSSAWPFRLNHLVARARDLKSPDFNADPQIGETYVGLSYGNGRAEILEIERLPSGAWSRVRIRSGWGVDSGFSIEQRAQLAMELEGKFTETWFTRSWWEQMNPIREDLA